MFSQLMSKTQAEEQDALLTRVKSQADENTNNLMALLSQPEETKQAQNLKTQQPKRVSNEAKMTYENDLQKLLSEDEEEKQQPLFSQLTNPGSRQDGAMTRKLHDVVQSSATLQSNYSKASQPEEQRILADSQWQGKLNFSQESKSLMEEATGCELNLATSSCLDYIFTEAKNEFMQVFSKMHGDSMMEE